MRTYSKGIALAAVAVLGIAVISPRTVHAATAPANATATIIAAIGIIKDPGGDLIFASIVPAVGPQTLVVSPASVKSCNGGLICTGVVSAASFTVSGGIGTTYAITLPGPTVITEPGLDTMNVTVFTSSLGATGGPIPGAGTETLTVGATLTVGDPQTAAAYTGTFNVTVDYN